MCLETSFHAPLPQQLPKQQNYDKFVKYSIQCQINYLVLCVWNSNLRVVCHKYVHVPLLFSAGFLWLNIHNNFAHSFIFCFFFLSSFLCTKRWIVWISCFEVMYRQTINHILMFLCVVAGYKGKLNCSTFMQNTKLLILKDDI